MMSLTRLIMNRELGIPGARQDLEKVFKQKVAYNLANDIFDSEIIRLSPDYYHGIFRCKDYVAILSTNKIDTNIKKVALFSLISKCKLWTLEITDVLDGSETKDCTLSESGMVLVNVPSKKNKIILLDGKVSGILSNENRYSIIVPFGRQILGCWRELKDDHEIHPYPQNTNIFFGELNQEGLLLTRYQLDNTRGRWTHIEVFDENFWVKLSGSKESDLTSIIEVVDRVLGTMYTFELPNNLEEEKFFSVCIVNNRLFYGKNVIRPWGQYNIEVAYEPTLCIFDLIERKIIAEIPTGTEKGELQKIVANDNYVAWLEYGTEEDCVKYLDIANKTIRVAVNTPFSAGISNVKLSINKNILSVTYQKGSTIGQVGDLLRKVIDMSSCELKSNVTYNRYSFVDFFIENESILIADHCRDQFEMYIENFNGNGHTKAEKTFRRALR